MSSKAIKTARPWKSVVLSLAALAVGTCLSASIDATFAGRTWYVSAYASAGGNGSREAPFRTIQEAVDAASAGDTVKISEGVFGTGTSSSSSPAGFASLSRVNVTKRLRITGAGRGKTVIEGAAALSGDADGCGAGAVRGFRIADSAAGTLIEKLTISGGRTLSADVTQVTSDSGVAVTYMDGDTAKWIDDTGANTAAKGGGVWYEGSSPVYLADATVEHCRAGYAGGAVCGNVVLLRVKVFHCRGGLYSSGALYGLTGAYSSWITGCGGTAAGKRANQDAVLGFPKGAAACTFVNCTFSASLGCGIPNRLAGRDGFFTPSCSFYNCAFFDSNTGTRFIDNQGAFPAWNCVMNSNGSMPNNKNNIGGDWGNNRLNERHLVISTDQHTPGSFDPYGTGYGWKQLVSPLTNARLRPGSALIDQGSNDWITVKGTFVPDEYVPYDFDGKARIQGEQVDMGAFEGGTAHGAMYTISNWVTYPVSFDGCPLDVSGYIAYFSGVPGEHLVLEADTGATPLYAFTTTGLTVNGNAASYRYLYPDGQSKKVDLIIDGNVASVSYTVTPAASTIWVSPDGNDSAAGTFDAPVRTLQAANDKSSANGVVFAKGGTYAEGEANTVTDNDWLRTTKNRLTVTKNLRVCGVEGAENTVIMGRHSTDTEGFQNSGCGAGALRCVGASGPYVAIQGFTITGGATDSDPIGKTAAAGKRDPKNYQAYNWGSSGVCGWSWNSSGQNFVQVIDCIISNNVAYRSTALANVVARRCLITENHTIDVALETNSVTHLGGLTMETSLFSCLVTNNPGITTFVICPEHATHVMMNNTICEPNASGTLFRSPGGTICNNIFLRCPGNLSAYVAMGNLVDPEVLELADGTIGVVAGSPAAMASTTNAWFAAAFSGGIDGVWPELPSPNCPAGCFQRFYPGVCGESAGGRGISNQGMTGADWGEQVVFTATDAATRNFLGFDIDGTLVSGSTSYSWMSYGFGDEPHVVRAVYATNWYVNATSVDDSKNGWTQETPKRTLAAALSLAVSGDMVHVAPGRYEEGTMLQDSALVAVPARSETWVPARAFVREGVSLVADGTAEETVIVGIRQDTSATRDYSWSTFQLGLANVRCVAMDANALIKGFTLTDGATAGDGGTVETDNACGGGVLAKNYTSRVEDCIITNCCAMWGGGGMMGTYVRCRFQHLAAVNTGGATRWAYLYGCYIDDCFDVPVAANRGAYNCTFGPNARYQFAGDVVNTLISDYDMPIVNCLILTRTSGKYLRSYTKAFNNLVSVDMGAVFGTSGSSANNVTNIPAAELAIDAAGRPLAGARAIDAGDNALLVEGLTAVSDLGGGQRIYNGTVDVGCGEYDWRPAFGAALGLDRAAAVVKADPDVLLAQQGLEIRDGALELGLQHGGGTVEATAQVLGGGVLHVSVDGVEAASQVAAQGVTNLVIRNPSGNESRALRFEYAAMDGDAQGAMLFSAAWNCGTMLFFR